MSYETINGLTEVREDVERDRLTQEPVLREGWRVEPRMWIPGETLSHVDEFQDALRALVKQFGGVYTGCGYGRHDRPTR